MPLLLWAACNDLPSADDCLEEKPSLGAWALRTFPLGAARVSLLPRRRSGEAHPSPGRLLPVGARRGAAYSMELDLAWRFATRAGKARVVKGPDASCSGVVRRFLRR
jgi:hypothetical protein